MSIPKDLLYAKTHEWVRLTQDGRAFIGITDHAQDALGDVAFINLCDEDENFNAGDVIGDIESIKAVTDIYTPIAGTVLSVNEELLDSPELINSEPYGAWLVELGDIEINDDLLDADAYELFLAEED
ncbi:MAG: glycine cleavage system protein GcvH [Clostridiales bacterium]|nr:glycine cleavage system protein GcvH [Clostridiales bacterium]